MSDLNKNTGTVNSGPSSPAKAQTVAHNQQIVERQTIPIPGYVILDNCLVLKDPNFQNEFREFFSDEKIRIYLREKYDTALVQNLVQALIASPIIDVKPLTRRDRKEDIIEKLSGYGSLGVQVFHKVKVLYKWFVDQLKFFALRGEIKVKLIEENYLWVQQWRKQKVKFAIIASMDSSALSVLLAHTEVGNISSTFADEDIFDSSIVYPDGISLFDKLGPHLLKRYDVYLLISKHIRAIEAARSAGFKIIHHASSEDSEYSRLGKLTDLTFSGKL